MKIANLAGAFTGQGLKRTEGRRPTMKDVGFMEGPVHIEIDPSSGLIAGVVQGPKLPVAEGDVEGDGFIATPGFVDCHTHAIFAGSRADEHFQRWAGASYRDIAAKGGGIKRTWRQTAEASDEELIRLLHERLDKMLSNGVTCVEIKSGYGGTPESELRLLRLIKQVKETRSSPRIVSTFMALHACPSGIDPQAYARSMLAILPIVKAENLAEFVDMFVEQGFFTLDVCKSFAQSTIEAGFLVKAHVDQLSSLDATEAFSKLGPFRSSIWSTFRTWESRS